MKLTPAQVRMLIRAHAGILLFCPQTFGPDVVVSGPSGVKHRLSTLRVLLEKSLLVRPVARQFSTRLKLTAAGRAALAAHRAAEPPK